MRTLQEKNRFLSETTSNFLTAGASLGVHLQFAGLGSLRVLGAMPMEGLQDVIVSVMVAIAMVSMGIAVVVIVIAGAAATEADLQHTPCLTEPLGELQERLQEFLQQCQRRWEFREWMSVIFLILGVVVVVLLVRNHQEKDQEGPLPVPVPMLPRALLVALGLGCLLAPWRPALSIHL